MRARTVTTALAALALTSSLAFAVSARAATTTQPTQTFTTAGTYYVTVPDRIDSAVLDGLGGAGYPGDPSSSGSSKGGAGGSGTRVRVTIGTLELDSGDVLKVVVGAKGGGGQRGYGSELSGSGGNGGGATVITDVTSGHVLLVAGGGGGGGGGSGLYIGYAGGRGGTAGDGAPGIGTLGDDAGRGGAAGQLVNCTLDETVTQGGTGESAPTASGVGGGGGGGQGTCGGGGQSGGSGEHGAGEGGGGGGGAGASFADNFGSDQQFSAGTNTDDGSATITFTTVNPVPPVFTTPNCTYLDNLAPSTDLQVGASGDPLPTFALLSGPNWLQDDGSEPNWFSGGGSVLFLHINGVPAPGQYRAQVEAMNEASSIIEPLTLVAGAKSPGFLSPNTATATAGSPFTFRVQAVECPPILYYSIDAPNDVPWLTIDRATGELSGTPTASDVGTHTITVEASTGGVVGTTLTQTLTVHVDPAAVTPPPVTIPPVTSTPPAPPTNPVPPATTPPAPPATTQPPAPPASSAGSTPPGSPSAGTAPAAPKPPAANKPSADLSVHLSGPVNVRRGRTFTETLTVTNRGPHRAGRVHVALRVPHGLAVTDAAGASRHGRALRWGIAALAAHATRTYTLTFDVVTRRHGHRTIRAAVRSLAAHDRHPGNNRFRARLILI